ncbi:hypothetical protein AMJ87_13675 [candidate division WOR_3 bacterium SM23_60]|uniref:Uncharacterized protein n=1 Tax=candidate division WOR_3 bacterium SM23_60 TaxID=1703780 RepID=A0A0S8G5U2_UNCW3|nr:MAG: hypothetical protein AMJ87_13675 [candidate division WOR_3 bacterium SM23_60]
MCPPTNKGWRKADHMYFVLLTFRGFMLYWNVLVLARSTMKAVGNAKKPGGMPRHQKKKMIRKLL